jgi:hypothetical protein
MVAIEFVDVRASARTVELMVQSAHVTTTTATPQCGTKSKQELRKVGNKYCGKRIISKDTMLLFNIRLTSSPRLEFVVCRRSVGHRGNCSAMPKKATVWNGLLVPVLPYYKPKGVLKGLRTLDKLGLINTLKKNPDPRLFKTLKRGE